jgi:uncharacterized protein
MISKDDAIAWLKANPELLAEHPELLDDLILSHQAGTASLIERQVERLRGENRELKEQLTGLTRIAAENERLMQRLHRLTLEVMSADSAGQFLECLFERLARDFNADHLRLWLFGPGPNEDSDVRISQLPDPSPAWLDRLIETGRTECGRLTQEKRKLLFSEHSDSIGSAALVPIPAIGLLVIGTESAERFFPGMGTLFLELLGKTIAYRLEFFETDHRKRA